MSNRTIRRRPRSRRGKKTRTRTRSRVQKGGVDCKAVPPDISILARQRRRMWFGHSGNIIRKTISKGSPDYESQTKLTEAQKTIQTIDTTFRIGGYVMMSGMALHMLYHWKANVARVRRVFSKLRNCSKREKLKKGQKREN